MGAYHHVFFAILPSKTVDFETEFLVPTTNV
jgi:hypothetical protein